jgi:hypothetical protein
MCKVKSVKGPCLPFFFPFLRNLFFLKGRTRKNRLRWILLCRHFAKDKDALTFVDNVPGIDTTLAQAVGVGDVGEFVTSFHKQPFAFQCLTVSM